MSWYAFDNIDDSFDAVKSFLWPFDKWVWLKLALVAFFVGGGFSFPTSYQYGGGPSDVPPPSTTPSIPWGIVFGVIAVIIGIVVVLGIVGGIMEFVLLDSVINREVRLRAYFGNRIGKGLRLFAFRFGLLLLTALPVLLIGGLFVVALGAPGLLFLFLLLPVLILFFITMGIVGLLTTDFVAPVMIAEDTGVIDAWRSFWPTLKNDWKQYGLYVVVRWALGLALNLLALLPTLIGIALLAIPFGFVGLVGVAVMGGVEPLVTTTAGIVFIGALVFLFAVIAVPFAFLIQVPVVTYLKYYALLVLGDSNDEFDLIPDVRDEIEEG